MIGVAYLLASAFWHVLITCLKVPRAVDRKGTGKPSAIIFAAPIARSTPSDVFIVDQKDPIRLV